jgi:hypothetical protein
MNAEYQYSHKRIGALHNCSNHAAQHSLVINAFDLARNNAAGTKEIGRIYSIIVGSYKHADPRSARKILPKDSHPPLFISAQKSSRSCR